MIFEIELSLKCNYNRIKQNRLLKSCGELENMIHSPDIKKYDDIE